MSEEIFEVEGLNGQIQFDGKSVKILRRGFLAKVGHGLKGEKTIPIKMISSIQFKKAGMLANGYIQFATGAGESRGGIQDAVKDENSVVFTVGLNEAFQELRVMIENSIVNLHSQTKDQVTPTALIRDLKNLMDEGIISQAEFEEKKSELLKNI